MRVIADRATVTAPEVEESLVTGAADAVIEGKAAAVTPLVALVSSADTATALLLAVINDASAAFETAGLPTSAPKGITAEVLGAVPVVGGEATICGRPRDAIAAAVGFAIAVTISAIFCPISDA
jgi:hypothetical protein